MSGQVVTMNENDITPGRDSTELDESIKKWYMDENKYTVDEISQKVGASRTCVSHRIMKMHKHGEIPYRSVSDKKRKKVKQ